MFLLNSCLDLFSAPCFRRDPLFRSYGVNLPSSLTVNLSSALVFSTRPPVSVCGTGLTWICLAGFLGSLITIAVSLPRRARCTVGSQHGRWICLPPVYLRPLTYVRLYADVSLLRHHVAPYKGIGILTDCPSDAPCGFSLGPDLP